MGDEATWISKIQNGGKEGGIEYYSVKNPDSQDIRNKITYEQARQKEAEFFATKTPWSNLEWLYQRRLGTDKLTRRLGQVLSDLISKRQVFDASNFGIDRNRFLGFPSCRESSIGFSSRRIMIFHASRVHRPLSQWQRY
jgi:hypothetical protein